MRKAGSARKRPAGGIKWDENNLTENEAIKASINKTKINEPKTPYHGPLTEEHMEDVDGGLQPLELDGAAGHHSHLQPSAADHQNGPSTSGAEAGTSTHAPGPCGSENGLQQGTDTTAGTTAEAAGPSGERMDVDAGAAAAAAAPAAAGGSGRSPSTAASEPETRSGFSSDSDHRASLTGGSDMEEESRRVFAQRRRAHYNMRAALRKAKELLSEEGEEEGAAGRNSSANSGADSGGGSGAKGANGGAQAGAEAAGGAAAAGEGTAETREGGVAAESKGDGEAGRGQEAVARAHKDAQMDEV